MNLLSLFSRGLLLVLLGLLAGCSGLQVLNTLTPESGYRRIADQVFDLTHGLKLDVYVPESAQRAPVVVFFYGGRWSWGSKDDYRFAGQALASRGFVTVVADYRQYPAVRFPAFVEDAARATVWAQRNAKRFGGDSEKLFVMGHSAGAHLAALIALDRRYLKNAGGDPHGLRGMIGLAGPYDFLPFTDADIKDMFGPPERYAQTQPIAFADGRNPPLLLLHGANDDKVWPKNTRNLAARVAAKGGSVETHIYPDMSHARIVAVLAAPLRRFGDVLDRVADFIGRQSG